MKPNIYRHFTLSLSIILLFASCNPSDIIKNDIQNKLGDSIYYSNDTCNGFPFSFCFSSYQYVSDYVVFNYGSEKMIVIDFKGNYIAYYRVLGNKYNQLDMDIFTGYFDLIDASGKKVTYRK